MLPPYGLCLPCSKAVVRTDGTISVCLDAGGLWIHRRLDMPETLAPGALPWLQATLTNGTPLSVVVSDVGEIARLLGGERNVRGEIYLGTEDKLTDLLRHAGLTVAPDAAGPG